MRKVKRGDTLVEVIFAIAVFVLSSQSTLAPNASKILRIGTSVLPSIITGGCSNWSSWPLILTLTSLFAGINGLLSITLTTVDSSPTLDSPPSIIISTLLLNSSLKKSYMLLAMVSPISLINNSSSLFEIIPAVS